MPPIPDECCLDNVPDIIETRAYVQNMHSPPKPARHLPTTMWTIHNQLQPTVNQKKSKKCPSKNAMEKCCQHSCAHSRVQFVYVMWLPTAVQLSNQLAKSDKRTWLTDVHNDDIVWKAACMFTALSWAYARSNVRKWHCKGAISEHALLEIRRLSLLCKRLARSDVHM